MYRFVDVKGEDTMSNLTRIALALVISLVIVAGVYFSVQALSAVARQDSLGMYMLNGSLVNPLQSQKEEAAQPELKTYPDSSGEGREGGCESEGDNSSDL